MPPIVDCPVCQRSHASHFRNVDSYAYYECPGCRSLFLDPRILQEIDAGRSLVTYDETYWAQELASAKERSWGPSLARVAEAFLYCRRPIGSFLDIGTGSGDLLDAVSTYLPNSRHIFYGVEMFPPAVHSHHPNYIVGSVGDFNLRFDAGCCIEVVEHLTPTMFERMLGGLANVSESRAFYIFNTGLPEFVRNEDPSYLDPLKRGHIVSYSLKGVRVIAERHGFKVHELPGKTWAFGLEYFGQDTNHSPVDENLTRRIWSACPENVTALKDPDMGSVLYVLGIDTARAYSVAVPVAMASKLRAGHALLRRLRRRLRLP